MAKARKLKSGSWNIQVYAGEIDGKRKYKSFTAPTKAEVQYMAADYERDRDKKAHTDKTVREAIEEYVALSQLLSPTTIANYKNILKRGFGALLDLPADDLTEPIAQKHINAESMRLTRYGKPISAKTVHNEWGLISAALGKVCDISLKVTLPRIRRTISDLPEPESIYAAIKGSSVELPCLLAMWCGLRMSEILGLTYERVKDGYIIIDQVMVTVGNETILKPLAKTDASIRKVAAPEMIIKLIQSAGEQSGLIVKMDRHEVYRRYKKLITQAGMEISFHDLRHVFASVMLTKLNLPSKVVQDAGGWKTDYVMRTVYSQNFDRTRREADAKRDQYFSALLENSEQNSEQNPKPVEI